MDVTNNHNLLRFPDSWSRLEDRLRNISLFSPALENRHLACTLLRLSNLVKEQEWASGRLPPAGEERMVIMLDALGLYELWSNDPALRGYASYLIHLATGYLEPPSGVFLYPTDYVHVISSTQYGPSLVVNRKAASKDNETKSMEPENTRENYKQDTSPHDVEGEGPSPAAQTQLVLEALERAWTIEDLLETQGHDPQLCQLSIKNEIDELLQLLSKHLDVLFTPDQHDAGLSGADVLQLKPILKKKPSIPQVDQATTSKNKRVHFQKAKGMKYEAEQAATQPVVGKEEYKARKPLPGRHFYAEAGPSSSK